MEVDRRFRRCPEGFDRNVGVTVTSRHEDKWLSDREGYDRIGTGVGREVSFPESFRMTSGGFRVLL